MKPAWESPGGTNPPLWRLALPTIRLQPPKDAARRPDVLYTRHSLPTTLLSYTFIGWFNSPRFCWVSGPFIGWLNRGRNVTWQGKLERRLDLVTVGTSLWGDLWRAQEWQHIAMATKGRPWASQLYTKTHSGTLTPGKCPQVLLWLYLATTCRVNPMMDSKGDILDLVASRCFSQDAIRFQEDPDEKWRLCLVGKQED